MLRYISPTSFMLWQYSPVKFWLKYLAPDELKPPHYPQTPQMAVGNVFDTHIKYHLGQTIGKELPADLLETTTEKQFLGRVEGVVVRVVGVGHEEIMPNSYRAGQPALPR